MNEPDHPRFDEPLHRDIKPQNVLRCDDVWKIAGFGISKLMNNPVLGYTSP